MLYFSNLLVLQKKRSVCIAGSMQPIVILGGVPSPASKLFLVLCPIRFWKVHRKAFLPRWRHLIARLQHPLKNCRTPDLHERVGTPLLQKSRFKVEF